MKFQCLPYHPLDCPELHRPLRRMAGAVALWSQHSVSQGAVQPRFHSRTACQRGRQGPPTGRDFPCSSSPDSGIPRTLKGNWLSITHPGHQREYMDWRTLSPFTTTQGQFLSVPGQLASFLPVSWWVKSGLAPRGSGSLPCQSLVEFRFRLFLELPAATDVDKFRFGGRCSRAPATFRAMVYRYKCSQLVRLPGFLISTRTSREQSSKGDSSSANSNK